MHKTTPVNSLRALEEAAPRNAIRGAAPVVRLQREPAVNDAVHAEAPVDARFLAAARLGLIDYALYEEARANRALLLGELIAATMQAIGAFVRRAWARYRQRREARATYMALRDLDDRTLRDLGFARDELISIAAEVTGGTERTRVHTVLPHVNP